MDHLRAQGLIESWRLTRRKLGFGPADLGDFHLMIEVKDLAQLDRAFDHVAERSESTETFHFRRQFPRSERPLCALPRFPRSTAPVWRGAVLIAERLFPPVEGGTVRQGGINGLNVPSPAHTLRFDA